MGMSTRLGGGGGGNDGMRFEQYGTEEGSSHDGDRSSGRRREKRMERSGSSEGRLKGKEKRQSDNGYGELMDVLSQMDRKR